MESVVECVVEYDYSAEQPDELNIRVGDVITHVERLDGGWWRGRLRGEIGMFPDNFVKVLPGPPVPPPGYPAKGEDVTLRSKKRCRVLFSYNPAHDDELQLQVDDSIDFMCEVEDGWWKGRLNGRVGVFPSNFVEMCNYDCDTSGPTTSIHSGGPPASLLNSSGPYSSGSGPNNSFLNHSGPTTSQHGSGPPSSLNNSGPPSSIAEMNKKNSLAGAGHNIANGLPSSEPVNHITNGTDNQEKTNSGGNNGPADQSQPHLMTTSERVLRNTAPPPDKAPRLPPKPEEQQQQLECGQSPVELRKVSSSHARPVHKSLSATETRIRLGGQLYEPEEEEEGIMLMAGPMFGSLSSQLHGRRASSALSVPVHSKSAGKTGFFKKLRHSFSGPGRISRYFSGTRFGSSCAEAQSLKVPSPPVKRRNSFATFLKKISPSPADSKYDLKIELSESSKRLSHSWEFGQAECLSESSHSLHRYPASFQDFNPDFLSSFSEMDRAFAATVEEGAGALDDDAFKIPNREPHVSGDSGIATTLGEATMRLSISADEIFGPFVEYNDDIHQEIFGSPTSTCAQQIRQRKPPSPADRTASAIAEEPEEESPSFDSPLPSPAAAPVAPPPQRWRNPIRTNAYVNWSPPASVRQLEKLTEITEL